MTKIDNYILKVNGLSFNGTHGVNPEEKLEPQIFKVDIEIALTPSILKDINDNINNGLSYSELAKVAKRIIEGEHCDLIETLAQRILNEVLSLSKNILYAKVTLHKPNAPLKVDFDDVIIILEGRN